tara:strand:+ start:74 stop:724 length:651 start_codon:yes stop_codon:yes gene_type:complete
MKSINEIEKNIDYLNDKINSLIGEGVTDVFSFIKNPRISTIKIIKGMFDDTEEEIKKKEEELKKSEEKSEEEKKQQTEEELSAINGLKDELRELKIALGKLRNAKQKDLPYKKAVVKFYDETKLDIEKMQSPDFKRTLKNTMFFKVFGFNEKNNTIDLKTNSFPDTIIIRLTFSNLKTNVDQRGDVRLIYNKYGAITKEDVVGEEVDVNFRFLTLS